MNVRGFRSMTVTLLMLAASMAIMAASVSSFTVKANRELNIGIVDLQRNTPPRQEFRSHFITLVKEAVGAACQSRIPVHPMITTVRDARRGLEDGSFDAALVLGTDRPASLRRLSLITIAGSLSPRSACQPISLMIPNGDAALKDRMEDAFARLIAFERTDNAAAPTAQVTRLPTVIGQLASAR